MYLHQCNSLGSDFANRRATGVGSPGDWHLRLDYPRFSNASDPESPESDALPFLLDCAIGNTPF
jgi:hypothetical protein